MSELAVRPKLTYAIQYFDKTGSMRAPYLICKALTDSGWNVDILTMSGSENEAIDYVWGKVPLHKVKGKTKKIKILKLVAALLGRRRQHVVVSFVWDWHCFALMLSKLLFDSPYVLVLDTYVHRSADNFRGRLRESFRFGSQLRYASMILAESPESFSRAKDYNKNAVVWHVPFCLWQRELQAVEAKWQEIGFSPEREPVIMFAGRLIERKHVHDLIEAFSRLDAKYPQWTLEIRGLGTSSSYFKRLKQMVAASGLQSRVQLLPGLSGHDLYKRYREISIFALPSEGEGMPTTITEAMYFGGAIVAGQSGAVSYQLNDGECGLLHRPGDVDVLTVHLDDLMSSQVKREEYMVKARARMIENFVWEKYFPMIENRLREFVKGNC